MSADRLMRFSPLSGLGASLSSWELMLAFWPALVLLVAAVLLGRYFCGWLCPLGTTIDFGDKVAAYLRGRQPSDNGDTPFESTSSRRLKYYLLALCVVTALAGLSLFGYLDPLSIAVRSYVLVVHAYVADVLGWVLGAFGLSGARDVVRAGLQAPTEIVFRLHVITALSLLAILALALLGRRYWCRTVCPLGALYALAGKRSLTARKVSDACIHCRRCVAACPTACISPDGERTLAGECILCLNCQAVCPTDAIRFFGPERDQLVEVDLTRRGALAALAASAVCYPLFKIDPSGRLTKGGTFIRPPLAGSDEEEFLQRCLRCGQCMRVCPTQVIQPAGLEGGLEPLWTPALATRLGYCTYECDRCGLACPSGAIPRFTLEQKHSTALGLAYVDTTRCIPWLGWQRRDEEGIEWDTCNCGVCEEVCPVPGKAIHLQRQRMPGGQELRLPYVREETCVGCGFCEYACPVAGKAAIRVTGGFRQLKPPEAGAERTAIQEALPVAVGGMRIIAPKRLYEGPNELFDYIDGGADPYLEFSFVRVATATYAADGAKLRADLWEFKTADDAFGAYSQDRSAGAGPLDVGDEGAVKVEPDGRASVWVRGGPYMMSIIPAGGASTEEQAVLLARETFDALNAPAAPRPEICRRLPSEELNPDSVRFARTPRHLYPIGLSDDVIGALGLTGSAVAAYGEYGVAPATTGLVLVRYADAADARAAAGRYSEVCNSRGYEAREAEGVPAFRVAEGKFSAVGSAGLHLGVSLSAPTREAAAALVRAALGE